MGRKICWICFFIFYLSALDVVATSRISIHNENNNLCDIINHDSFSADILEIRKEI